MGEKNQVSIDQEEIHKRAALKGRKWLFFLNKRLSKKVLKIKLRLIYFTGGWM